MAERWRTRVGMACGAVLIALGAARAADVVPDLDRVEGIKQFDGPPAARELLQRNGFVVVPRFYRQIFSPYVHSGLPPFITTDSLHRTFHVIFEEQIKRVEAALAKDVAEITKAMLAGLAAGEATEAGRLARGYFLVAQSLLSGDEAPADAPKEVAAELALIRAAAGVAASPLYGYEMDYSQCKPRGFYIETPLLQRYFRAMSWYGNAAFRLVSDRETRAAMLIAERFAADEGARKAWEKADRLYTHLIAPADDLTPLEYCPVASYARDASATDPLSACRKILGKLRDPKINSMVIPPQDMPRWRELSKGMRFFGKRYLPDSEVFMHLTLPAVPGRGFPCGLDVMAANGSARAAELLRAEGHFAERGYAAGFAKAESLLAELKAAPQRSHYVNFLRLAETLWSPPPDAAAPFMKTPAYGDKGLLTALAAWASTRHTWQLQAKQSVTYAGERDEPPRGYVEPNMPFFQRLDELVAQTIEVLKDVEGIDGQRLQAFRELVAQVRTIAEKQLEGKPLTGNESRLLDGYGPAIGRLSYFEGNAWLADENLPWMSLVADVHTEHLEAKTLEVATGGGMSIFAAIPYGGKLYLMVGGVYSYYEFLQPLADRLTDEAWKRRCERGDLPPMPAWTASFVPGRDVEALLEKLRQGGVSDDLRYVQDPRIAEILKKELAPGGRFAEGKPRELAIHLFGLKAGRDGMPLLLTLLDSASHDDRRAAERALATACDARDIPMLKRLLLKPGEHNTYAPLNLLVRLNAWDEVLDAFQRTTSREVKDRIADRLGWEGVKDATPALLAAYRANAGPRQTILQALGRIWDVRPNRRTLGGPPRSTLSDEQQEQLRKEVRALVLDALKGHSPLEHQALEAVGALQIEEAIPLVEGMASDRLPRMAISALKQLQCDEAGAALLRILKKRAGDRQVDPQLCAELLSALQRKHVPEAAPVLLPLLDDTRDTRYNDQRVCDWAMDTLARFEPDGPGYWRPQDDATPALDAQVAAWKLYLKIRQAGGPPKADPAALADKLLGLAEMREKDRWSRHPDQSIRWVIMARKMIPAANEAQSQRADALLPPLTRKEVKWIAEMMGRYHENFGECPPETPGQWERVFEEKRYIALDHSRFDKQGRLCDPWGQPYRYLNPARHSKQPVEFYSFGPNSKDEDGGGDDIASWKQE